MDYLDANSWDSISYASEIHKLADGQYEARTDINGTVVSARGVTETEAALALDEAVEKATTAGEVQFGGV